MRKFLCIGHRGARGLEPENTLRSVRKALELGADGIEVDVYFADGNLVVIHDETLERTTNGTGRVEEKPFDYLRSLDAGCGEKIPTLREVFDAVDRSAFVNVELKGTGTAEPVAELIAEYVNGHGWSGEDFLVSSFDLTELRKLAGRGIRLGVLFTKPPADFPAIAKSLGAHSIHLASQFAGRRMVGKAHACGLAVFVYTVNSAAAIVKMRELGADGVFTDYPDRMA